MQLKQRKWMVLRILIMAALMGSVGSCGDEIATEPQPTWMLGTWSSGGLGASTDAGSQVRRYEFFADGRLIEGDWDYTKNAVIVSRELTWEREGPDTIVVQLPSGWYKAWRIRLADADPVFKRKSCDFLQFTQINPQGQESLFIVPRRGEICSSPNPACKSVEHCPEAWQNHWCDGPPPPCEDEEPAP